MSSMPARVSLRWKSLALVAAVGVTAGLAVPAVVLGQAMPDPKQISGVPLPTNDLPAGTMSVRVIRGSFANNLPGVPVTFVVDGKTTVVKTGADGRAEIANLAPGAHVTAATDVGSEHLTSQDIVIAQSGIRIVLAATDPSVTARQSEDQALAAGPPVKGTVALGPNTRIVVDFSQDRLNIYYVAEILNTARTPVDIGGPLIFNLPVDAQGPSLLEESTKQAVVKDGRVIVTGPFAPGVTTVDVAFAEPYQGGTAHIEQKWPVAIPQLAILAMKVGAVDLSSPQITTKRDVTDQGQAIVAAQTSAIAAGQPLELDVTGLPYHPLWPRYTALSIAGVFATLGLWAAFVTPRRRRTA